MRAAITLEQHIDWIARDKLIKEAGFDDVDVLPAVPIKVKGIQARNPVKGIITIHVNIRAGRFFDEQSVRDDERGAARDRPRERRALGVEGYIDQHDDG